MLIQDMTQHCQCNLLGVIQHVLGGVVRLTADVADYVCMACCMSQGVTHDSASLRLAEAASAGTVSYL